MSGPSSAVRQADRIGIPLASRRAVATIRRVLGHLRQPSVAELAEPVGERDECDARLRRSTPPSCATISASISGCRKIELQRNESLSRAGFQVLECMLVSRVVGDDQLKAWSGLDDLACFLQGQQAAIVGQAGGSRRWYRFALR